MFEQSARWNEYYREPEPRRRRELLDQLCMTEPDDGANDYRRMLFRARHVDEKQPGREVDRFLFNCLNFAQIWASARWFKRYARRETLKALDDMLCGKAGAYGTAGERAFYWEIRNAAARYLKTCESAGFNRSLFGMIASGDESRAERVCRDVWRMSEGLAGRLELRGQLRLWNRAVQDAYFMSDPGAQRRFEAYCEKNQS